MFYQKKDEYDKHEHHFCSQKCHYEFQHEIIICKNCGKEKYVKKGEKRQFCSHKCALEYNSKHQKTNHETIICKKCGKIFESQISNKRQFCSSECMYKWRKENKIETDYNKKRRADAKRKFYNEFNKKIDNIELLSEYINSTTKIHCMCKEHNNDFFILPNKILDGQSGCQKCNSSKGEQVICDYCIAHDIIFIPQQRFDDCKDINTLPFDFYLPTYNILIEYDGEQHYHPINWGGISDEEAKRNFEIVKRHDKIKTEYCEVHNIYLIRIPYYEKDNINNILDRKILLK